MPTYIDESGDTGHSKDSMPFFRLAAVWVPSLDEAEALREEIRRFRQEIQLPQTYEFKFGKSHNQPERRRGFFQAARRREFRYAVCSIAKTGEYWRKASSEDLYWAAATTLSVAMRSIYLQAENPTKALDDPIFVDDNGDRKFLKAIATAFRGLKSRYHEQLPIVRKPEFRDSQTDELIQLADMLCGATGAFLNGDPTWHDMVKMNCNGIDCLA